MEWIESMVRPGLHLGIVILGNGTGFAAIGDNAEHAVVRVLEQAGREDAEALYELGVRLGMRGEHSGGRPPLVGRED